MSVNVFPAPITTVADYDEVVTATSANIFYESTYNFTPGVYTITSPATVIAKAQFWSATTSLIETSTVSGTVTISLATAAEKIKFWTESGSDVPISIAKTGEPVSAVTSGVAYVFTNTSNSNTSGTYYA